jgi:NDP-sugar pyrophosphorylase family protein
MSGEMQILILATCEREKLSPLTDTMPACMLPVANRPVMAYTIENLAQQGYKHMLISLLAQAYQIEGYFDSGRRWGVTLDYRLQRDPLGSAGALKWAGHSLKETFLVFPADILLDLNVAALLKHHRERASMATMVIHPAPESKLHQKHMTTKSDFTADEVDGNGHRAPYIQTGVYLFEPEVLDFIPARTPYDISTQLIPALRSTGKIVTDFVNDGYLNLLDTVTDYQMAQMDVLKSGAMNQPLRARQQSTGIWTGRNNRIHPSASLTAPVLIGSNTWIDRGVELGPEVVVGSNVMIRSQTQVRHSTILDNTYLGQMLYIENKAVQYDLMVDAQSGEHIRLADPLLAGQSLPSEFGGTIRRLFDCAVAAGLLLITLPLTLIIAGLTWLSTGSVVKRQPVIRHRARPGDDRPMMLLQFAVEDKKGQITSTGQWLQQFELHRLPELWNVLTGDMHLVGVKPLPVDAAHLLKEDWHRKRYECLPGITGLWYTQHTDLSPSGQIDNLDEMLVADAFYTATNNWRTDFKLLLQTPFAWLRHVRSNEAFRKRRRITKQWNS